MRCRKKAVSAIALPLVLALAISLAAAGCGGKKQTSIPTEPAERRTMTQPAGTAPTGAQGQKVLVVIADTIFEDAEYEAVKSALSGSGYQPVVANSSGKTSVGSQGTQVPPDTTIDKANASEYAAIILIGGSGAQEYYDNAKLQAIVREAAADGKVVGAICIAPVVLANAGVLEGKRGTVYLDERGKLSAKGCKVQNEPVVVEGKIITAEGPDVAGRFASEVVKALENP